MQKIYLPSWKGLFKTDKNTKCIPVCDVYEHFRIRNTTLFQGQYFSD